MKIYLDHNATTPVDREVLAAMLPFFRDTAGNASSIHSSGQDARRGVEEARQSVAALIGAQPGEIVFTSGGTEADNLAVLGVVGASNSERKRVIATRIEHHAVLHSCEELERRGVDISYVAVSGQGIVDPADVRAALRPETVLITVMHANNELGTIQPLEEIGRIAAEADVWFHTDAVQSAGKIPVDVNRISADLLSISAHKIYGPKGAGALYLRSGTPLAPQMFGGHSERNRRPGTENVPGIVGFGAAAKLAAQRMEDGARIARLRDRLEAGILDAVPHTQVNGLGAARVPNTTNITFGYAEGGSLVIALDLLGVQCATGAACASGAVDPSHVLTAIGLEAESARGSLRFSLGRETTEAEIDFALEMIPAAVERLRAISPAYRR